MRRAAITLRGLYILILAIFLLTGRMNLFMIFIPPFFISYLLIFRNGSKDPRFYIADTILGIGFIFAMALWLFDFWQVDQTQFGIDKLLHAIAGAALGVTGAALFSPPQPAAPARHLSPPRAFGKPSLLYSHPFLASLFFTLIIGIAWEGFEWSFSLVPARFYVPWTGLEDSLIDLFADMAGAGAVLFTLPFLLALPPQR